MGRDQFVVHNGNPRDRARSMSYFGESSLVNQLTHHVHRRITIGDVRLHQFEHVDRGFVQFDEHCVVDLE